MIDLFSEDPPQEVIPDAERSTLQEFARGLAAMNETVNAMRGVRRGIVVREFEKEVKRLEDERLKRKYGNH